MKMRMTNEQFYQNSDEPSFDNINITNDQIKFRATLDEGVDDTEPIRSILNEEDLVNNQLPPKVKKGKKFKITKQAS